QHAIQVKQATTNLLKTQGESALTQADLIAGAHDAVDKANPQDKPAAYRQALAGLHRAGVDVSQMPPDYPGDEEFKFLGAAVKGHKQQLEDAFKQAETAAKQSEANKNRFMNVNGTLYDVSGASPVPALKDANDPRAWSDLVDNVVPREGNV